MSEPDGAEGYLRPAKLDDGPALCDLFRRVTMDADLHLAVERDPDFFALYAMQGCPWHAFAFELNGRVEAMGSFLARDAWVHGEGQRIGYACDLRLTLAARGGRFLRQHMGAGFLEASRALGFDLALTAVITSNRAAVRALVERRAPTQPLYTPLREFRITNLLFTHRRAPRPSAFRVRAATLADLDALGELLAQDHAQRAYGERLDAQVLSERFTRWPGLGIESFRLAHDASGRLVGAVALWDAHPVKRYRVLGYRGSMRAVRWGFNAVSRLTGATPLPPPGELLRYFYLTHVSVRGEDPAVMAALLDHVYAERYGQGFAFFSACVLHGDPLAPAFARYRSTTLPATLYVTTAPGSAPPRLPSGRPGFEMALA